MKKFIFKFETILGVKEKREEQLKRELMHLLGMKAEQERMLKEIQNKKRDAHHQKSEIPSGNTVLNFVYFEEYLGFLRGNIESTEKRIKALEKKADIKREEVITASKEKKTFEKLKERHFEQFKQLVIQNEQKTLDEIAVSKFNRKEQHSI